MEDGPSELPTHLSALVTFIAVQSEFHGTCTSLRPFTDDTVLPKELSSEVGFLLPLAPTHQHSSLTLGFLRSLLEVAMIKSSHWGHGVVPDRHDCSYGT